MENICNVNTNQKRDVVAILKSKKHTIEQGKLAIKQGIYIIQSQVRYYEANCDIQQWSFKIYDTKTDGIQIGNIQIQYYCWTLQYSSFSN